MQIFYTVRGEILLLDIPLQGGGVLVTVRVIRAIRMYWNVPQPYSKLRLKLATNKTLEARRSLSHSPSPSLLQPSTYNHANLRKDSHWKDHYP